MEHDSTGYGGGRLSHVDEQGTARMVDVGGKDATRRVARAGARVWMAPATMRLLREQALPKGDVLAVARVAGIMAAKKTSELIPLCHPLALDQVQISFSPAMDEPRVDIECTARTEGRTGVEMEALTGASVAALTIYDMCKAVDREMVIGDIRLLEKRGGKEDYVREEQEGTPVVTPTASVVSVNVSPGKGERKKPVPSVTFREGHGIEGDGHAGPWHRQVSLLAEESIDTMVAKGLDVGPGDFAENVTTRGIELPSLPIGTRLRIGPALVEVTQIGKVCHDRCAIFYQAGDCVMPREGIFVRVLEGGRVAAGASIAVVELGSGEPRGRRAGRRGRRRLVSGMPSGCRFAAAVVTVSDKGAAGIRPDGSGPVLRDLLRAAGAEVGDPHIVPDEQDQLEALLRELADSGDVDLVLTTGGTGLAPRDRTPEATLAVVDRLAPGFAEAMRAASLLVTPHAMLSRAVAGVRGRTLIINLSGSPKACREQFAVIAPALPHAVETVAGQAYECATPAGGSPSPDGGT